MDDTTNLIYTIVISCVGVLALTTNVCLFICVMNVKIAFFRESNMFFFCDFVLELGSTFLVIAIQPRLFSFENMYFFLLQGPVRYLNLGLGNVVLIDIFLSLIYTRIFFYSLNWIYNVVKYKTTMCSLSTAAVISIAALFSVFTVIFIIFYRCRTFIETMKYEAYMYNIDYLDRNNNYRVSWLSKENCPLTFLIGYAAIFMSCLWIPLFITLVIIAKPAIESPSTNSIFLTKKEKISSKDLVKLALSLSLTKSLLHVPSVCVYLFYETVTNYGILPLIIDLVIFLSPLLSCVICPSLSIYYVKDYREYLCSLIPRRKQKSNIQSIKSVYHK